VGWRADPVTIRLVDPTTMLDADWPPGAETLRAYATSFARCGSEHLIANVRTRLLVLLDDDVAIPVTVNDAEYDNSYVCSPYTAYVAYARAELHLLRNPSLQLGLGRLIDVAGAALARARINRMVVVNNWLLSTNLYPRRWAPDIPELTARLIRAFPDHYICFRSLNAWTNASLSAALAGARYSLVASRQVYVYDHPQHDWLDSQDVRRDRRLLRQTAYRVVEHDGLAESDYARMAALYDRLYRQKYPKHNPAFTAEYMRLCHRQRLMSFVGLRSPEDRLDGVVGMFEMDRVLTAPIVGYDTALDRRLGLYRLLMLQPFAAAMSAGSNVNLSAGAASFKRLRGGRPVIEYCAIFDRHLPGHRRLAVGVLGLLANRVAVPLMRKLQL
jgi:hypothetical protein